MFCLVVLAGYKIVRTRSVPAIPAVLVAYVVVYLAAELHGSSSPLFQDARFFTRVIAAFAVAALVTTAAQRRRVLLLIVFSSPLRRSLLS